MTGFLNSQKPPVRPILIGAAVCIAVTTLLLCVICAVFSFTSSVPYPLLPYILLIADAAGAFTGAYVAAALNKSRGLILGLIVGLILFVILLIFGLGTGETIGVMTLLRFFVIMVFGILGGIKGVNKKEKIRIK